MLDFPMSALAGALWEWEGGESVEKNLFGEAFAPPYPKLGTRRLSVEVQARQPPERIPGSLTFWTSVFPSVKWGIWFICKIYFGPEAL